MRSHRSILSQGLPSEKGERPSPFIFSYWILSLPKSKWNEELGWVSSVAQGEARIQAEMEMLLHRSCASELVSGGSEAASGHSLPSLYMPSQNSSTRQPGHLSCSLKDWIVCASPQGYTGNFILLYGVALVHLHCAQSPAVLRGDRLPVLL